MKSREFDSKLLDERYVRAKLPSGLTAYVFPKKGMQKKIAIYGTLYGSIDNEFFHAGKKFSMPPGIAHFLEHEMFKKERGDLLIEFSKNGASSNAGTEYSTTCYFFSCIDRFAENLDTLTDLVFDPYFRDDWVAKEKLIIAQELKMYRDMPDMRIYQNLQESLWRKHPVRLDIGGTVESIQGITRENLDTCWRTFYAPSNMALVVAGDVDAESLLATVESRIANKKLGANGRIRRIYPREPRDLEARRRSEAMQVARPKFLMGFKETALPANGRARVVRNIEMGLVLESFLGRGSALYNRLYEKGLIDDSFAASYSCTPTYGATYLGGETDDPEALERELLAGLKEFLRDGVRRRDVDRTRRRYLGGFLRSFDAVEQCAFALLRFHFQGIDAFELPTMIRHVPASAVTKRARAHFGEENRALSLVTPKP